MQNLKALESSNPNVKKYYDGAREALQRTDKLGNGDGKVTAQEYGQNSILLNNSIFQNNADLNTQANKIAAMQQDIMAKYAGEDGILDEYEYVEGLNSKEYSKTLEEWHALKNQMEAENKFGKEYIAGADQKVADHGEKYGDENGNATAGSFYKEMSALNRAVFKDNIVSRIKAQFLTAQQTNIMNKYAGDDGILSGAEYAEALNSKEYRENIEQWRKLMEAQESQAAKGQNIELQA